MAEAQESPTLEEGQQAQPEAQAQAQAKGAQVDVSKEAVNDLVAELEKQGVQSPEQLQGMATASQQAGQLANLLGQERQRAQMLQRQLEEAKALRASRKDDYYGEEAQLTAKDIEGIVRRSIAQDVPAVMAQTYHGIISQTAAAQNAELQVLSQIQNDSLYETLGDVFQKHMMNPRTQMKVRQGQSNMLMEYQNIKDRFYQKMIKRLQGNVSEIEQKGLGASRPPHIEGAETQTARPPAELNKKQTQLKKAVEEGQGTDDDVDRVLEALMPDEDPFFHQR